MATSIAFNDGAAATLTNAKPTPADRFASWAPRSAPVGPREHALGTGALHAFVFRWDYGCTFELRGIPAASMGVMDRLVRHLASGGTVTVNTGDSANRSYVAGLAPGAELPYPTLSDPQMLEYSMSFALIHQGAQPAPMLCTYG